MSSGTPTKEETLAWADQQIRIDTARLALDPAEQIAWLKQIDTYPLLDELALEFTFSYELCDQLVDAGRMSPEIYAELGRIDALLDDLSNGTEENWLPEALESDPRWAKVREIAREVAPCL
ncbi:MAG: hypothetical protein ACRDHF_16320 [Tepidiformaceae bacterium]